jgi:MFS family permease
MSYTPSIPAARAPGLNEKILFWASFFTLIAAGMGFAIRGDILNDWGRQFGFTQTELGGITGMGLVGFGLTIIFFSFFADVVGYGWLMVIAFLLHALSVVGTLAAPFAFQQFGKEGAYWCLFASQCSFALANGTCEAVINPLTATIFPHNKTHWLNILHAGWPGGLVLGAAVSWVLINVFHAGWQVRWVIIFAPMLLYGVLMVGRRFPRSEAHEHGVSLPQMMKQTGILGFAVVAFLFGFWLSQFVLPAGWAWLGWVAALVLWLGYGAATTFTLGHLILAFLFVIHALVGYVELGTDSWIINITNTVLENKNLALLALGWTSFLMFILRFFAGPIVHKISPLGLLFCSAVLGTAGLYMMGMPFSNTTWAWLAVVTVYGIGKTFYWPTMLGVVSERYPRGGALALGICGGIGMLSAGTLGSPLIGYKQDYAAVHELRQRSEPTYERYKAAEATSPLPELPKVADRDLNLPKIAGLDNGKVGVLKDYMKITKEGTEKSSQGQELQLEKDIELLKQRGEENADLEKRLHWWEEEGKPHAKEDDPYIQQAQLYGSKKAMTWTAYVPATMAVCYLLLILYFMAIGGYKAQVLVGHAAEDERFTGGVEGPGEG